MRSVVHALQCDVAVEKVFWTHPLALTYCLPHVMFTPSPSPLHFTLVFLLVCGKVICHFVMCLERERGLHKHTTQCVQVCIWLLSSVCTYDVIYSCTRTLCTGTRCGSLEHENHVCMLQDARCHV